MRALAKPSQPLAGLDDAPGPKRCAATDACITPLRKAGAKQVIIACFARVLEEALDYADYGHAPLAA